MLSCYLLNWNISVSDSYTSSVLAVLHWRGAAAAALIVVQPQTHSAYTSKDDKNCPFESILLRVADVCVKTRCFNVVATSQPLCVASFPGSLCRIYRGCSRKSCNAVNLSQDFRLLSICPMLFCFRLFYFRFKSFLRAELKCDLAKICFRHAAQCVYRIF